MTGHSSLCPAMAFGPVPEPPPIHASLTTHSAQRTCHFNHTATKEHYRHLALMRQSSQHNHFHTDFTELSISEKRKVFCSIVVACLRPPWSKNNNSLRSQETAVSGRLVGDIGEVKAWRGNLQSPVKMMWTSSVPKLMGKRVSLSIIGKSVSLLR